MAVACGRLNRSGLPELANPDELSDVEFDIDELLLDEDDDENWLDGFEREFASERSVRHFNSEAPFAPEAQTAIAKSAIAPSRQPASGSRLWTLDSRLLVTRVLSCVVWCFLRNSDVMGMVLPHAGCGDLDESCFRA